MSENKLDNETLEMIGAFVSEAVDSLDNAEPLVEEIKTSSDPEVINTIFRVFHTLKGLSGFFGMKVVNRLTHEAETLLDLLRKQTVPVTDELITLIYTTFDMLRDLLHLIANEFTDQAGEDEAESMKLIIIDAIEKIKNGDTNQVQSENDFAEFMAPPISVQAKTQESNEFEAYVLNSSDNQVVEQSYNISEPDIDTDFTIVEDAKSSIEPNLEMDLGGLISEDMIMQFIADSKDLLETTENNLLKLEKEPDDFDLIATIFGAIHSIKGNSGFMGFEEIQEISMDTEMILDSLRKKELEADPIVVSLLLSNIETLINRVNNIGIESNPPATEVKQVQPTPKVSVATPPEKVAAKVEPVQNVPSEKIAPKPIVNQNVAPTIVKEKKDEQNVSKNFQQTQKQDIRVETVKIDKLFDLVGELITIETMVTKNPDLNGLIMPNFVKAANQLNKITRELQEITMSVRMMPLEGLFNKMKRLIRDVSIKLGKKVDLTISGQETEMDKNVIDEISDPLVHILRNSMDHGVETPEVRIASGKSDTGAVHLSARYEGNEILISVKDDGAGINKERVLQKAEEKGLLQVPAEKMTDKEIFTLIFEPGFSTAAQVTDISGRGVGMDVVRKNIEKLRGAIDVESVLHKGTTVTLRIPLTLAIMEALLVNVGVETFALPLMNVSETFRVSSAAVSKTMDGLEMIKVRDEILPVFRIHELYNIKPRFTDLERGIILIVESRSKKFCLFADELIGQQQAVIKGLSEYIGKVPGIIGCMILGDGGIGLILDIEGTLTLAENPLSFNNSNLVMA
jgi:two-component system chemotaxis sensor kinase CheA